MTSRFIQSASEVTKEWLGEVLDADIALVSMRENMAFNSSVAHLDVTYGSDQAKFPEHFVVKVNQGHDGQNEIQFYQLAESIHLSMIPRQFALGYDPRSGASYLLLEDLSDSHRSPVTREGLISLKGIPDRTDLESVVDVLAHFQAAFWEHPAFGTLPVTTEMRWWYRDEDSHVQHLERRTAEWQRFVERFENQAPAEWIALGESALRALPKLFETRIRPRLSPLRALTMSQGDCYLTQFLVPRSASGASYLIDFQDACVNFPTYDLVYMFATFWTREQRAQQEEYVLRRYLQGLQSQGVQYAWETLCDDYRLCLCYMLFDAVWNATSGSAREYWLPKLRCLIQAYQDWDCARL